MSAKYTFLAWDTPIENAPLKLALLQLANNSDDNGFSYYSISRMAKACGMSERTFMRKIAELEKMGVLTVERRPNRPSLYKLIGDEMGVTLCHLQTLEVTESHQGVTESHPVGDRESHDPNSYPNTNPNSKDLLSDSKSDAVEVLEHLNKVTGSKFKPSTASHIKNINGRLNDGATVEECKRVIDFKHNQWKGTQQAQYLRPATLFAPKNFDGYLMAAKTAKPQRNVNDIGNGFQAPSNWETV